MGVVMGLGQILGGVCGPLLAGRLSDAYGLAAPCWLLATLAVLGTLAVLFLRETEPRVLAGRATLEGVPA